MSLSSVEVVSGVLLTCASHALSTESEEVMGLLLGNIRWDNGSAISRVWRAVPQIRKDRRKDRVEPSHEHLSSCIGIAERLTKETGLDTKIVGWYHSHPNITVQPSHVDLRTQAQHQTLDDGFVGLIISCFNKDQKLHCTAFQSESVQEESSSVPLSVEHEDPDILEALKLSLEDSNSKGKALSQNWIHKTVPVTICEGQGPWEHGLEDIVSLERMIWTEEKQGYIEATETDVSFPLSSIHNEAVYLQSLSRLMDLVLFPALTMLRQMVSQDHLQSQKLSAEISAYKAGRHQSQKSSQGAGESENLTIGRTSMDANSVRAFDRISEAEFLINAGEGVNVLHAQINPQEDDSHCAANSLSRSKQNLQQKFLGDLELGSFHGPGQHNHFLNIGQDGLYPSSAIVRDMPQAQMRLNRELPTTKLKGGDEPWNRSHLPSSPGDLELPLYRQKLNSKDAEFSVSNRGVMDRNVHVSSTFTAEELLPDQSTRRASPSEDALRTQLHKLLDYPSNKGSPDTQTGFDLPDHAEHSGASSVRHKLEGVSTMGSKNFMQCEGRHSSDNLAISHIDKSINSNRPRSSSRGDATFERTVDLEKWSQNTLNAFSDLNPISKASTSDWKPSRTSSVIPAPTDLISKPNPWTARHSQSQDRTCGHDPIQETSVPNLGRQSIDILTESELDIQRKESTKDSESVRSGLYSGNMLQGSSGVDASETRKQDSKTGGQQSHRNRSQGSKGPKKRSGEYGKRN